MYTEFIVFYFCAASIKRLDFQALDMVAEERIIDMKIRKSNGQKCSILVEYHRQIKVSRETAGDSVN